jgi:hypothetical protein
MFCEVHTYLRITWAIGVWDRSMSQLFCDRTSQIRLQPEIPPMNVMFLAALVVLAAGNLQHTLSIAMMCNRALQLAWRRYT